MPKIVNEDEIFQAVAKTVVERGYAGATTKQMAQVAGVSEVTLFRKYGTKAELVKTAMLTVMARTNLGTHAQYTGDVAHDLLRVTEAYHQSVELYGLFFLTMISEIPRMPELADLMDSPLGPVGNVGQLLVRYQTEGVLVEEHPMHAISAVIGPIILNQMLRTSRPDMATPPLDLAAHVARFLHGRQTTQSS